MAAPTIEFRCPTVDCGRLLFKVNDVDGLEVETKCPRCKETVTAKLVTAEAVAAV